MFVERRDGVIVGLYANHQEGIADEELADDNAEVLAFLDAPHLLEEAIKARLAELDADTQRQQIVTVLKDHPAAIETWVRNQINADSVTTLAQGQQCMKRIETALVMIAKFIASQA